MKKNNLFILLLISVAKLCIAQFDPPAGQAGTKAMYKDSTAFIAWATGCTVTRGYQNIANPSTGYATGGDISSPVGKANRSVLCLGDGGSAILTFLQPITDGPGADFAIFENSFNDSFLELAFVEVSSDGVNYHRFPATSNTQDTLQLDNAAEMDARKINNLAGKHMALYGTPFNLEELSGISGLDIHHITHIKIIDVVGSIQSAFASVDMNGNTINDPWPTEFAIGGFDLDAVGVIHQAPVSVGENPVTVQFKIYPNPVTASSFIQLNLDVAQPVTIDVLDLTGRQIAVIRDKDQVQPADLISLSDINLKNGVYFLRVSTQHSSTSKKMVINEF